MHNDTPEFIDAPEFSEDDKRMMAQTMVLEGLSRPDLDIIEFMDIHSRNNDECGRLLHRISELVKADEPMMNMLTANCADIMRDKIQERLEGEGNG